MQNKDWIERNAIVQVLLKCTLLQFFCIYRTFNFHPIAFICMLSVLLPIQCHNLHLVRTVLYVLWEERCKRSDTFIHLILLTYWNTFMYRATTTFRVYIYIYIYIFTYTLSQKNICTQKKLIHNHETRHKFSLGRHMQMIKILISTRQG